MLAGLGSAAAADLKLLTAGAFKSVALELVPEFEKKTGHKVTIENDTAGALARRVAAGEYFDVVVMPPGAMAPLLGTKLVESSAKPLARVGIGVSIKQGAPVPDISTVDAWKQSLLKARAIAYTDPASGGTAGTYLANLFEKMGIAAELKPKTVLVKGGLAGEKLSQRRGRHRHAAVERAFGRAGHGAGRTDPARCADLHPLFRRRQHRRARSGGGRCAVEVAVGT